MVNYYWWWNKRFFITRGGEMILDESRKTKKNVTSKGKFFILYEALT